MLKINKKIEIFEEILLFQNNSYADIVKDKIHDYYFEQLGNGNNIENFSFLNSLENKDDVCKIIDLVVSKIIMNEHHAGFEDLLFEYMI
jgi:hypothetical protein